MELKIQHNSRQIPKTEEYTANKMYSDIVYAWLQVNSCRRGEEQVRWLSRKEINFSAMADSLGINRRTVAIKFKKLLDYDEKGNPGLGLVHFNEELDRYELAPLDKEFAMLIENGTLSKMVSALNEKAISAYVTLFNRYFANKQQPFLFTIDQIKEAIGISTNSRTNNYIVTDILFILSKLELLTYEIRCEKNGSCVKKNYWITSMSNIIPNSIRDQSIGRENY